MATTSRKVHTFRGGEYVAALMAELSKAGIAQRIAQAREETGLTQTELAELMEVHYRTVQDWESPKKEVTPYGRMNELAACLGVTTEWLLHGEREATADDVQGLSHRLAELEGDVAKTREDMGEALELLRLLATERASGQDDQAGEA